MDEDLTMFRDAVSRFAEAEMVPYDEQWRHQKHVGHEIWRKAGAQGLLCTDIPAEYGGAGGDFRHEAVVYEETQRRGLSGFGQGVHSICAHYILNHGTEEQKQRFLPRMATGEDIWAQGWSEPGAGSDMAAIRCKAVRDGDHYVISGQKTWSTRAVWADWLFGLFRTDPDSVRHHGLTFILLPLNLPGITIRPVQQLNGQTGFAEIFFDEVRVPVHNRLADEGAGWQVAMATAGFERGLMLRSPGRFQQTAKSLVDLYRRHQARADADPSVRDAVMRSWMDAEAYALATYRTACRLAKGGQIGAEASTNKIFWSELDLLIIKSRGADVRVVYSPIDCLKIARANPDKQVVFFGVGFETTAPANAMSVDLAKRIQRGIQTSLRQNGASHRTGAARLSPKRLQVRATHVAVPHDLDRALGPGKQFADHSDTF